MQDDFFTQTALSIVIFDLRDNAIWTLRSGGMDDIHGRNSAIAIGETITLKDSKRYIVKDVQLVKLNDGWQVSVRVDDAF